MRAPARRPPHGTIDPSALLGTPPARRRLPAIAGTPPGAARHTERGGRRRLAGGLVARNRPGTSLAIPPGRSSNRETGDRAPSGAAERARGGGRATTPRGVGGRRRDRSHGIRDLPARRGAAAKSGCWSSCPDDSQDAGHARRRLIPRGSWSCGGFGLAGRGPLSGCTDVQPARVRACAIGTDLSQGSRKTCALAPTRRAGCSTSPTRCPSSASPA